MKFVAALIIIVGLVTNTARADFSKPPKDFIRTPAEMSALWDPVFYGVAQTSSSTDLRSLARLSGGIPRAFGIGYEEAFWEMRAVTDKYVAQGWMQWLEDEDKAQPVTYWGVYFPNRRVQFTQSYYAERSRAEAAERERNLTSPSEIKPAAVPPIISTSTATSSVVPEQAQTAQSSIFRKSWDWIFGNVLNFVIFVFGTALATSIGIWVTRWHNKRWPEKAKRGRT